jgi:hypothetical protein
MRRRIPPLFLMAAGFGIWASAFVLLYSAASLGCELGWNHIRLGPISLLRTILIGLWLIHMAALTWLFVHCARAARDDDHRDRFIHRAAMYLTVAAIASTVWLALALGVPSECT